MHYFPRMHSNSSMSTFQIWSSCCKIQDLGSLKWNVRIDHGNSSEKPIYIKEHFSFHPKPSSLFWLIQLPSLTAENMHCKLHKVERLYIIHDGVDIDNLNY